MKAVILFLVLMICPGIVEAQLPGGTDLTAGNLGTQKVPNTWFIKAKGYEKALAAQKETGADIFVVFTRQSPADEKGLCRWLESKGLSTRTVRDYLKTYIKVSVPLPSNPDSQKMAEDFAVRKCPSVFIVQPNGKRYYCKVFEYPDDHPKLFPPETLIELFRARSSDRYQAGLTSDTNAHAAERE